MPTVRIFLDALSTTALVAGPLLLVALVAGVAIGLLQAVVQVNESSLGFIAKLSAVAIVLVVFGSTLAGGVVEYTRRSFVALEEVVR
jgi:flagellar biosynthetic protein FliQ